MSGTTASVILHTPFTVADTGLVSQLLRGNATDVTETRKGRHWEFTESGSRASLAIFETAGRVEVEADLLDAGLLANDVPEIVVITYPSKHDRARCSRIAALVAQNCPDLVLASETDDMIDSHRPFADPLSRSYWYTIGSSESIALL